MLDSEICPQEEWTKKAPRRLLRTASISVSAVERMAISAKVSEKSLNKMPSIGGGISEDAEDEDAEDDAASQGTGSANVSWSRDTSNDQGH